MLSLALAGCSSLVGEQVSDRIPAAVIINTIKCDLAKYVAYERATLGPFILSGGSPIEAKLTLNIVDERTAGGGVDLDFGSILPFQGAVLGFGLSDSLKRTATIERVIELKFTPLAEDLSICRRVGKDVMENGVGLYTFLVTTRSDIQQARRGPPLALVDKLSYSTSFGVERKRSESANFGFVPVKASIAGTQARSDVQKIEVSFTTKKQAKRSEVRDSNPSSPKKCDPARETCPFVHPRTKRKPKTAACDPRRETCPFSPQTPTQ